jgi:2'-5' RNA ligase
MSADIEPAPAAPAPRRRIFFALWPDATTRRAIVRATRGAVRRCGGKPTPEANLHVTLAFLGPVDTETLGTVEALVPPPVAPFALVLDRLGLWERAQILWLAPSEPPPVLAALERGLWDRLEALGFTPDPRTYHAHITLARKAQAAHATVARIVWPVASVALVESKTGPRHSRYTVLKTWDLRPPDGGPGGS